MDCLESLKEIFDYVRIINPEDKVIKASLGPEYFHTITHNECYQFWHKNKVCENCISMRAIAENRSLVKFEMESGKVYMVIAAPFHLEGQLCAIELIKDVSDNHIVENITRLSNMDYSNIIEELNRSVVTDGLTGLYNKRYIQEHLPYEIRQIQTKGMPIAIAIADIDHFKRINDTYGHLLGDEILKQFGALLKDSVRSHGDWVARYGGEEFLIVLKNINAEPFEHLINRIRENIENSQFLVEDKRIQFTISIGGVHMSRASEDNYMTYLSEADSLLYEAKNNGRNRCEVKILK